MSNIKKFKIQFDRYLQSFLTKRLTVYHKLGKGSLIPTFVDQNVNIALAGGKRLRPFVASLMYKTCGGKDKKDITEIGLGLELLHLFLLAHDDIVDRGTVRHGLPTAHVFAQHLLAKHKRHGNIEHIGQSQGMLSSDLLWAWSQECIVGNGTMSNQRILALKALREMTDEVFVGEMIDVDGTTKSNISLAELKRSHILKTARYSFVGPMRIGSRLATGSTKWDTFSQEFGHALGLAFQIQDDVLDILSDTEGKSAMVDLQNRQHTYVTYFVFEKAAAKYKKQLQQVFGQTLVKKDYKHIRQMFLESGAVDFANTEAKKNFAKAHRVLESSNIPKKYLPEWQGLVSKIEHRT